MRCLNCIVGLLFIFTLVKMKGPNKYLNLNVKNVNNAFLWLKWWMSLWYKVIKLFESMFEIFLEFFSKKYINFRLKSKSLFHFLLHQTPNKTGSCSLILVEWIEQLLCNLKVQVQIPEECTVFFCSIQVVRIWGWFL